jgi:bidirectional [NiFe] hydrogenase diaphorase subunit
MAVKTLTIDGKHVGAEESETILEAATDAGINIPTLCHLDGLTNVAACRLCLVEIAGSKKLLPACVTNVAEGMEVKTDSEKLHKYRAMILELLFAGGTIFARSVFLTGTVSCKATRNNKV